MRFDRGFIYFVTDVKSQKVEFEKPFILLQLSAELVENASSQRLPINILRGDD